MLINLGMSAGFLNDVLLMLSLSVYQYLLPNGTVAVGLFVLLGFNILYASISAVVAIIEVSIWYSIAHVTTGWDHFIPFYVVRYIMF